MRKLWPSDVGVSVEEGGLSLRFLQASINIPDPSEKKYIITPYNPNVDFARGVTEHQHTARLSPFYNAFVSTFDDLRQFLIGRFLSYNVILRVDICTGKEATVLILLEIHRLDWPTC